VHPGDLAGGFSDLEMIWLLYCADVATDRCTSVRDCSQCCVSFDKFMALCVCNIWAKLFEESTRMIWWISISKWINVRRHSRKKVK